jgi:outer membrane lipoprotein
MIANRRAFALLAFLHVLCGGCALVISRHLRDEAAIAPSFRDLVAHPEEYQGRVVILGGYILGLQNEPSGTVITLLQAPLDFEDKPKSRDLSEGRFAVTTDKFLDPEVCVKDRQLAVGGRVSGVRGQSVRGMTHRYPVIKAQEIHLWPEEIYQGPPPYYPFYGLVSMVPLGVSIGVPVPKVRQTSAIH